MFKKYFKYYRFVGLTFILTKTGWEQFLRPGKFVISVFKAEASKTPYDYFFNDVD